MNVIGNAIEELYRIFHILNYDKFGNSLPEPVITIQKTKGNVLGHFTKDRVWIDKNHVEDEQTSYYEINVDPRWFCDRTSQEVVETLLHEMCHYKNRVDNINDCNGNNHNKKFKRLAESVGLLVERGKSVGYGYTSLSDDLKAYIDKYVKPDDKAFEYFRSTHVIGDRDSGSKVRKKSIFTYTCPDCGQVAKAKRDVVIKCGFCNVQMEIENDD